MLDINQVLAWSKDMLLISVIISVACALLCGFIASRRHLRVPFWAVMGFAFGPFALPFIFLAKPATGNKPDSGGISS